jgi:hypothetical protein
MEKPLLNNNLVDLILKLVELNKSSERNERKFKVRNGQSIAVESILRQTEFYEAFPSRKVSSIYFDDDVFSYAKHNIDGERYRLKPRVRWYDNHYNSAKLEIKYRDGFSGYKNSYKDFGFSDNQNSFENILNNTIIFLQKNYSLKDLKPTVKVSYTRRYFEHPSGIRATIDTNVTAEGINTLNAYKSTAGMLLAFEVLEIKYKTSMDDFVREYIYPNFYTLSTRLTKCSKYVESVIALTDNVSHGS